jgi:hypothetical protein
MTKNVNFIDFTYQADDYPFDFDRDIGPPVRPRRPIDPGEIKLYKIYSYNIVKSEQVFSFHYNTTKQVRGRRYITGGWTLHLKKEAPTIYLLDV